MQVSSRSLCNSCTPWPRLNLIHLMRFFSSWAALRSGYLRLQAFQQVLKLPKPVHVISAGAEN